MTLANLVLLMKKTIPKKTKLDPVLEVEQWKDAVDRKIKNMSLKQLKHYYTQVLRLVSPQATRHS